MDSVLFRVVTSVKLTGVYRETNRSLEQLTFLLALLCWGMLSTEVVGKDGVDAPDLVIGTEVARGGIFREVFM